MNSINRLVLRPFFAAVNQSYARIFTLGLCAGFGFEVFKIKFEPRPGVSYYRVSEISQLYG